MKLKLLITFILVLVLLIGCSASTGTRYESKEETKSSNTNSVDVKKQVEEEFDITPYETEIDIEAPPISTDKLPPDIWYEYSTLTPDSARKIIGTADGYRVQVISTDDIDEANLVRSEIYQHTSRKEVYVIFEPPFYKVKVGDFTSKTEAENLRFKLNQLGYTESKVIQETVNLFE